MPPTHASLFRKTFSVPEEAASVLRVHVPEGLSEGIEWGSLRLEDGVFVDEELRDRLTDLLFSCQCRGRPAWLYVLFEHQSTEDAAMPYRLADYILRALRRHHENYPGTEPWPVIPVVLAQTGTNWRTPTRLSDLFPSTLGQDADLRAQHLDFAYHLIDLSALPYPKIHYRPVARLTLHLLKWARDTDAPVAVALEASVWRAVAHQELVHFFRYMLRQRPLDKKTMKTELLTMKDETLRTTALSTYDQLLLEGEARGEARGEVKGKVEGVREAVVDVLAERFGEVPYVVRERLGEVREIEQLHQLLRAAVVVTSIAGFEARLG
jgi:predicted transposase YdaD